jgi:hypothetical protein
MSFLDSFGYNSAPRVSSFGGAPYAPVNQNVPPPTVSPSNPPLTMPGVQGPSGTDITTPQSKGSNGFLDVVGNVLGGMAHGIGDVLNAPSYYVANPLAELVSFSPSYDPLGTLEAGQEIFQNAKTFGETGGRQGSINPMDIFPILNRKFEENPAPGINKFVGSMAFNPLTYLSSGTLEATQVGLLAAGIKGTGIAANTAEGVGMAMDPLVAGMSHYEQAVNAATKGLMNFSGGIINANPSTPYQLQAALRDTSQAGIDAASHLIDRIPSDIARDNARAALSSILPSGLVENILNYVPEEYSGIPIGPLSNYINKASIGGKQLGLPSIISLPDFRRIAVQNAQQIGYDSLFRTMGNSIDLNAINTNLRAIYSSPVEQLTPSEAYVKSLMQEPSKFTADDISKLSKAVNGSLNDPNNLQVQSFNQLVSLYSRGNIDTATTMQGMANSLGANLATNPDHASTILDAIRSQDQRAYDFIDNLTKIGDKRGMLDFMGDHAGKIADAEFTSGVQQQRLQNTLFGDFLNNFDSAYTEIWKGKIGSFTRGLQSLGIQTLGMPFMQVGEAYLRHIVEGGGVWAGQIDKDAFMARNANVPNVPFDVRRASYHGFTDQMDESLLERISGSNPVLGWLADKEKWLNTWTNNSRNALYLHYWDTALNQEITAAANAKGLVLRPDANAFFDAVKPPDVTQVPELSNVSQKFVNDITSGAVRAAGNSDAIDVIKNNLSANNINRYAVTHALDGDDLISSMGVSPRAVLRDNILNGDGTAASLSDAIDKAIAQQKAILKESPPVKADIMDGAVNSIVSRMDSPTFGPRDLNNSLAQILQIHNQIADMPWLYRQAEYDAVQGAIRSPNGWRGAIHEEYNNNITDFLKRSDGILQRAYTALNDQGDKLGVGDITRQITSNLEADRLQLQANWETDKNFQKNFFESNPDKSNPSTWANESGSGYYDTRQKIWDGYGTMHAKNMTGVSMGQTNLANAIMAKQATGEIAPDLNVLAHSVGLATSEDAVTPEPLLQWAESAGKHTASAQGMNVEINRNPTSKRWSYSITQPGTDATMPAQGDVVKLPQAIDATSSIGKVIPAGEEVKISGPSTDGRTEIILGDNVTRLSVPDGMISQPGSPDIVHAANQGRFSNINAARGAAENHLAKLTTPANLDPVTQGLMDIAEHGFATGQTPTEITSALNDSINAGTGDASTESLFNPSSTATESQVSGAAGNNTINQSGNAAAVNEPPDPNSWLGAQYANLESTIRPRIEQVIAEQTANPKITEEAVNYLKSHIDKIHTEFNQMPQEPQRMWNEVLDVASQRASDRITQGFTNYNERTNFDALMLHVFPYWMHESQRWPWLTRTFIGKPTATAMWQAYQDQTNQGYVPLSELPLVGGVARLFPGGDSLQVNPTRLITPFNPIQPSNLFRSTNFDEGVAGNMQQLDRMMSVMGVSPFDVWDIGESLSQGNLGAEIPTPIKASLNIARGSNVPMLSGAAADIQKMLPDNYRDYYTRMILASNGFEPDEVYDNALGGDESAQQTLDVAQQQSSLVQSVLAQTGSMVRFRTPQYLDYQDARTKAVETMTGISQYDQELMKNDGVTIRQIKGLSPSQREELANLPGAENFNELTEPLLNPAARKLRQQQREFYKTLDSERESVQGDQEADDRRLQGGIISGVEWRKRYQDRAGRVSDLLSDLKKAPAYKDVPVSADEQAQARARYNLPAYVMSPEDIGLQQYYAVKPETDVVTGEVNWSKFFDDRQSVIDSNPTLKPLLDQKLAKNNTAQVVDFKNSAEVLRPYFGIKDEILSKYPQAAALVRQAQLIQNQDPVLGQQFKDNNPELKTLSAIVRQTQQQARLNFPQIDQALVKYYGAQPAQYQTWAKKYQAPTLQRNIPQYQAAI